MFLYYAIFHAILYLPMEMFLYYAIFHAILYLSMEMFLYYAIFHAILYLSMEMFLYYAIFHAILYLSNIIQSKTKSCGTFSNTKSSAEKSGDWNIRMKSYKNFPTNDKDTETSDFLLAKAPYHIEEDEADLYKKPRGKSYRQSKETKTLPDLTSLPDFTLLPLHYQISLDYLISLHVLSPLQLIIWHRAQNHPMSRMK